MRTLIVGAGVIGTVYGAHLGASGHEVVVLAHGDRTDEIANSGLVARDIDTGRYVTSPASITNLAAASTFDVVLIALRRDNLGEGLRGLNRLRGRPLILPFGNYYGVSLPAEWAKAVPFGFPGVAGTLRSGLAEYVKIPQQPTTLQRRSDSRLEALSGVLSDRGFPIRWVESMVGWLAYHAVLIACIVAALDLYETDPVALSHDRTGLSLMCGAITEGFGILHDRGIRDLPPNLAVLHSRPLKPLAVRYWARYMRSPLGELAFAAHARRAKAEMREIRERLLEDLVDPSDPSTPLFRLLSPVH